MKKRKPVFEVIILALAMLLCFGVKLLFHACGAKDDGSYMSCHYAEQAVFAFGIVLVIEAAFVLLLPKKELRHGAALSLVPTAVLTAVLPANFIPLCMMETMRCRSVMRPAVLIIGLLLAALSMCYVVLDRKTENEA